MPLMIAISGYGQPENRSAALAAGFDIHLIKPVDNDALEKVISHAIRLQRLARLKQAAQTLVGQGGVEERDRALLDASLDRAL